MPDPIATKAGVVNRPCHAYTLLLRITQIPEPLVIPGAGIVGIFVWGWSVMSEMPLLKVCGLGRKKPGSEDWLLRGICFDVCGGDRLAVTGPSGSGKTVLLRALALLDPPDEGRIEWRGSPLHGDAIPTFRREVTYLHQRPVLFDGTVEDNLKRPFALRAHDGKRFDRATVAGLLASLNRDEAFLEKPAGDLSGGEAQMVALVRCLQLDPALLLLDEPTASLDRIAAGNVEALVSRWQNEAPNDRSVLWVSHDDEQSKRVSNRTLRLHFGRIQTEK